MKILCERIKELRQEKGLSAVQLAKEINVSDSAIIRWENSQRLPNIIALVALAKYFGVTLDYLVGLEN